MVAVQTILVFVVVVGLIAKVIFKATGTTFHLSWFAAMIGCNSLALVVYQELGLSVALSLAGLGCGIIGMFLTIFGIFTRRAVIIGKCHEQYETNTDR